MIALEALTVAAAVLFAIAAAGMWWLCFQMRRDARKERKSAAAAGRVYAVALAELVRAQRAYKQAEADADAQRDGMLAAKRRYDLATDAGDPYAPGRWPPVAHPLAARHERRGPNGDEALAVPLGALPLEPVRSASCASCGAVAPAGGLTRSFTGNGTEKVCRDTEACQRRRADQAAGR